MKTAAEVANHPKAHLHRELVTFLRARGSIAGAELAWREMPSHRRLWRRAVRFGFGEVLRQEQLNHVAFPRHNRAEVDAALAAGNNLRALHELASGVGARWRGPLPGWAQRSQSNPPPSLMKAFTGTTILLLALVRLASAQEAPTSPTPEATAAAPKVTYSSVHVAGPYLAMTFDDGPHATLTPKLLDLLAEKKIKATFFVLGENVARHPEIVRRAVAEGHEIGNHSWAHPNLARLSDEALRDQLQRTDDRIAQATGLHPKVMRPPYGSLTARQRLWVHREFGYKVILWDVDPLDWKEPGPSVVARRLISGAKAGSILLSHDIHAQTIAAMPETFDALLAKGFKFVTVSELIALAQRQPAPVQPKTSPTAAPPSTSQAELTL